MQTRRDFMVSSSAALLAAGLTSIEKPSWAGAGKPGHGRIVRIIDEQMIKNDRPVLDEAIRMLERGICEFTGKSKPAEGWSSIFSASDMVGIKINCLGKPKMSTTPEVVDAIVAGLKSAGVKEDRIVVFDLFGSHMTMSRFKLRDKDQSVRFVHNKQWGYEEEWRTHPSGKTKLTNILLKADKVISVPVFKDHALSGVTCALKNMAFGCVINPSAHHRNMCDPGIANLYNLPPIREKTALIVADGAFIQYDGGPQSTPAARLPFNSLFLTTDPVALDKMAWEYIDELRKKNNKPLLDKRPNKPVHVATAASLGLGTDDRAKIKLIEKKLS